MSRGMRKQGAPSVCLTFPPPPPAAAISPSQAQTLDDSGPVTASPRSAHRTPSSSRPTSRPSSVPPSPALTRSRHSFSAPPRTLEQELADLQDQTNAMAEARHAAGKAAKTDDAMIVVLRPFCDC
eukprot:m.93281 g.93281  ORF g.93281 m.93281 type:complete len:125 (-) comp13803_c0_seq1:21-395(-)